MATSPREASSAASDVFPEPGLPVTRKAAIGQYRRSMPGLLSTDWRHLRQVCISGPISRIDSSAASTIDCSMPGVYARMVTTPSLSWVRIAAIVFWDKLRQLLSRNDTNKQYPPAMRRILLTGLSGSGKSTLIRELAQRGYKAVDTD